ncbi:ubiquitin C-terminal hydrolase 12-like [Gastrolobium bilobum]|uniref:ubiquitin C-terminal hydrolase 12-like n=1 Tax=Gastrolobium bilobum TaxID=150636 RepID=UPI002AB2458A|nr:ubiquitin C-terminal hydrolase 12-like [Gastrolobium bilobum]
MKTENPILSIRPMKESSVEKCVSEEFEAGGHKWSLSIYPTGNLKEDGQDHVSIYLVLMNPSSSPLDWEVNANVNFSVYNFLNDEFVATQDTTIRRFHVLKTECGIQKFVDIDTFKDPSNGYLIGDTCVFGVEVFVVKTMNKDDCLSMIHEPVTHSYTCPKFSNSSSSWEYKQLVALAKFKNSNSGFLVNDSCILEAEFKVLAVIAYKID